MMALRLSYAIIITLSYLSFATCDNNTEKVERSSTTKENASSPQESKAEGVVDDDEEVAEIDHRNLSTYEELYKAGIQSYLDERWNECVDYLEAAMVDHRWHTKNLISCRRTCSAEATESPLLSPDLDSQQQYYETVVKNALCLLKCRTEKFGKRKGFAASLETEKDFDIRKPYDYLQLCLFKTGRYQDAADAAVTVLAVQPHHEIMANNLKQYIEKFSADPEELTNLEFQDYAKEYVAGDKAHSDGDFEKSVAHMEECLRLYWEALADCRAMCEEPFDMGWFPDFISSVANHFTFTFRCKRKCPAKLSNLYGEEIPNFLSTIFSYLQFGYFKLNNIPAVGGAVESALAINPTDATMIRNKQFYVSEHPKSDRFFVARKDVVKHATKERYEEDLLNYIDTEFVFLEDEENIQNQMGAKDSAGQRLRDLVYDLFRVELPVFEKTEL